MFINMYISHIHRRYPGEKSVTPRGGQKYLLKYFFQIMTKERKVWGGQMWEGLQEKAPKARFIKQILVISQEVSCKLVILLFKEGHTLTNIDLVYKNFPSKG